MFCKLKRIPFPWPDGDHLGRGKWSLPLPLPQLWNFHVFLSHMQGPFEVKTSCRDDSTGHPRSLSLSKMRLESSLEMLGSAIVIAGIHQPALWTPELVARASMDVPES